MKNESETRKWKKKVKQENGKYSHGQVDDEREQSENYPQVHVKGVDQDIIVEVVEPAASQGGEHAV